MSDLVDVYFSEAFDALNNFIEIPLYNALFEDANEEIKKAEKSNAENDSKAGNKIAKAFNAIKNFIMRLVQRIKNKIKLLTASKEYKDDFAKFKEMCKKDPKFANTKITIQDYDEYLDKYEKAINDAEKAYNASLNDNDEISTNKDFITEALKKVGISAGTMAKPVLKQVTIQAAINIAATDERRARKILKAVQGDYDAIFTIASEMGISTNGLEDANATLTELLGEKDKKKLEKRLKKLSHRWGWVRMRAGAREHLNDSCFKAIADIRKNILPIMAKTLNDPDVREKITDPALNAGVDITKATVGNLRDTQKELKARGKWEKHQNKIAKRIHKQEEKDNAYRAVKAMGYKPNMINVHKYLNGTLGPKQEAAILRESVRDIFLDDLLDE